MRIRFIDARRHEQFLFALHFRRVVHVLVWVGGLVFEDFDEFVESCGDDGAEHGAEPVDPVVVLEAEVYYCWSERTGWVQAAAGEVDAC